MRAHRATYTDRQVSDQAPSRKSVFWFYNSPVSPAPGMAIIAYLGPAYIPRTHGNAQNTLVNFLRSSHENIDEYRKRHKEKTFVVYQDVVLNSAMYESSPPRNRQQVADLKHRERKERGLSDRKISKSFNCAQISNY